MITLPVVTGASIASAAGADYLCYITPAEHLGLPGPESVKEGLIAFRIAAHIGDTVKNKNMGNDKKVALMRARSIGKARYGALSTLHGHVTSLMAIQSVRCAVNFVRLRL